MEKRKQRVPMKNILLRSLAVAGVLSIALMAPKVTRLLKEFDRPAKNRARLYGRIAQGLARLERAGLVTVQGAYKDRRVKLTEKGREAIRQIEFREYRIPEPAFWDGKWRVLVFDVKERRRSVRAQLRRLLQGQGFFRLQDSVWIYPYSCDEFVSLVRAHLKSGVGEMRAFVAEALESDKPLREHFRIPELTLR